MKIKPMLARLQSAIGRDDLIEQMVLLPEPKTPVLQAAKASKSVTLVVGYNGSPDSHAALDITLLVAHQTRLATNKQVSVKIVYVIDENQSNQCLEPVNNGSISHQLFDFCSVPALSSTKSASAQANVNVLEKSEGITSFEPYTFRTNSSQNNSFERADSILWQARYLVEEWRDAFAAYLRIGCVAKELREVVELEAADILFLGCNSVKHPIVQKLGDNFPCPVLGIPQCID